MKSLLLAAVAILLAANVAAEECDAAKTDSAEGRSYVVEKCVARVNEVLRTSVDGYVSTHYIVQYRGQRLVVFDPTEAGRAIGDQVSFWVMKLEAPASARSPGYRALIAQVSLSEPHAQRQP